MKSVLKLVFLNVFILNSFLSYAQITITDVVKKEINITSKPEPYDSLTDYGYTEMKKFIGLQFYLPPCTKSDSGEVKYDRMKLSIFSKSPNIHLLNTHSDEICNKYYTLIDILKADKLNFVWHQLFTSVVNDGYRDEEWIRPNELFVLKKGTDGDTLYSNELIGFKLVPFFVKQKQLYQNKYVIFEPKGYGEAKGVQVSDLQTYEKKNKQRWR